MIKLANRVRESAAPAGPFSYLLQGAPAGFQDFTQFQHADTVAYVAVRGGQWEVGEGFYSASEQTERYLGRTRILASSESGIGGLRVDWGDSTDPVDVFCAPAAEHLALLDVNGNLPLEKIIGGLGYTPADPANFAGRVESVALPLPNSGTTYTFAVPAGWQVFEMHVTGAAEPGFANIAYAVNGA